MTSSCFWHFNPIHKTQTQKVLRQLCNGFIVSKITYGLEAYGYTSTSNVSKMQTMQYKLLKLDIRTHTNTVHKMMNILKREDIHKTKVLAFVNTFVMKKMSCSIWTVLQYQKHLVLYRASWEFIGIIKPDRKRWSIIKSGRCWKVEQYRRQHEKL